jgi:hypothetical protein
MRSFHASRRREILDRLRFGGSIFALVPSNSPNTSSPCSTVGMSGMALAGEVLPRAGRLICIREPGPPMVQATMSLNWYCWQLPTKFCSSADARYLAGLHFSSRCQRYWPSIMEHAVWLEKQDRSPSSATSGYVSVEKEVSTGRIRQQGRGALKPQRRPGV